MRDAIRAILGRPVGVLVASAALAAMGALSFLGIPLQLLPDGFEQRFLTVHAGLRDVSAEEAERQVAIPIEESLATVPGIESIASRSDRMDVRVTVELRKDADPATVERDVRDRMARVEADLPDDVDRLHVRREGANDAPVLFFACTADADRLDLSDFMEERLQPRLEAVDGVARAQPWGVLTRTVRIWLDQEEVARRRLDLRRLLERLRGDNLSSDLGDIKAEGRKAFVRATMDFDSLDEIRAFPVTEGVTLGEIARVEIVPSLDEGWSRYNGSPVVVGTIYKMAGANTVETCRRVREALDAITAAAPLPNLAFRPFFDQGELIENSISTLYKNALYGGLLAVAVLYVFFRRLRMTLLVAAALPLSLTIAVTCLYLAGDSLNLATMMGLTLAVGMLVDNAIVVVEAILRRREAGEAVRSAAMEGTAEVGLAVVTSTLTTMVVVLPFIFLSEDSDARIWLASIGMPIAYALLASLAVALILVPLGSVYLRRKGEAPPSLSPDPTPSPAAEGPPAPLPGVRGRYARVLRFALRHRLAVTVAGVLLCASMAFPFARLGQKGAMGRGRGPVRIALRWPRHYTLADADLAAKQYEAFVQGLKEELDLDGIYARFDRRGGMAMVWQERGAAVDAKVVEERVREGWPRIPGVWTSLEAASGGTTRVTLEGEDAQALERAITGIEARLKVLPSVAETRRERETGIDELQVNVDPEAIERGLVSRDLVRGMVGWIVRGARLRDYQAKGRDLPVLVELDPEQAVEVRDLGEVLVPTTAGLRPLSSVTKLGIREAAIAIERRDGRRVSELEVVGRTDDDRAFTDEVQSVLREFELPPGVRFQVSGSWQELQENFKTLLTAMYLACTLVFLLTGVLFEALLLPLAVLVAIPPALAGGVWGLYLSGKPMDELSFLGGILLIGVVVNNGIVLIDRAQQRRREGMPMRAAIAAAGSDRLRPVLMTATTTIVGLLPMAIFKPQGNEIPYDTLATVVIGGLTVSTAVTLLLVPVAYSLFADLGRVMWRGFRTRLGG
ncbi:MAG TPA: efflux RND transporter permease subunit [Planctomycetota bacterium]|nr:efflux RND transporter permease subunit [Planctomycetota bacterium]